MAREYSRAELIDIIRRESPRLGVDACTMLAYASIESSFDNLARNSGGYWGLFQMGRQACADVGVTYGPQLEDPVYSLEAAVKLMRRNQQILQGSVSQMAPWMWYAAHQQGAGGLRDLLRAGNGPVPPRYRQAVAQNGGNPNGTAAQFLYMWRERFAQHAQPFGTCGRAPGSPLAPNGALDRRAPNDASGIGRLIVGRARSYVGRLERPGSNVGFQDPAFEEKLRAVGWSSGSAWCMYFAKLVHAEAYSDAGDAATSQEVRKEWNGGTQSMWAMFRQGRFDGFRTGSTPVPGCMFFQSHGGGKGHVGIVAEVRPDGSLLCIEGNTNAQGSREGGKVGVVNRPADDPRRLGFVYPRGAQGAAGAAPADDASAGQAQADPLPNIPDFEVRRPVVTRVERPLVRAVFEPRILLQELSMPYPDCPKDGEDYPAYQMWVGGRYPLVRVNGYIFAEDDISELTVTESGLVPEVQGTFRVKQGTFLTKHMVKDGDILELFIRSRDDAFKPIRNDYIIEDAPTSMSGDPQGDKVTVRLSGRLRVPKMYGDAARSYDMTSHACLQQVADELGLGFATNVDSTDDRMKWIRSFQTYEDFITAVTSRAWKAQDCFFTSFIDVYYYLNFVEVNRQLGAGEPGAALISSEEFAALAHDGQKTPHTAGKLILTNFPRMRGTNMFFDRFQVINNSSSNHHENGYADFIQFYDTATRKAWSMRVEPLVTPGAEGDVLLRGRAGEKDHEETVRHVYAGVQYSGPEGNVHSNYIYAKVHNERNLLALSNLNVRLSLPVPNFNVHRMMSVGALFTITEDIWRMRAAAAPGEDVDQSHMTIDKTYTGQYVLVEKKLCYRKGAGFSHELLLARREWPIPDPAAADAPPPPAPSNPQPPASPKAPEKPGDAAEPGKSKTKRKGTRR